MPNLHQLQRYLAIAATGLLAAGSIARAAPAETSFSAQAAVLKQITITQLATLDFGLIDAPSSGYQSWRVRQSNGVIELDDSAGANDGAAISGHQRGQILIDGSGSTAIILITDGQPCSTGGSPSASVELLSVERSGGPNPMLPVTLNIGGTLQVSAGAAGGDYTCPYTVTARYQ